jgi:hypothetical protein
VDRRVDVAIALAVATLGVVILVATQQIGKSPVPDPVGPRGVPLILGTFFVVAGLVLALRRLLRWNHEGTLVAPEGSEDDPGVPPGSATRALSIWFAALVYVITLPFVGYLIGTPVFIGFMLWRLDFDRPPLLRIPALVVYPAAFTVVTYLFFANFLGVRIPLGVVREIALSVMG